ncbi:MAG TPA: hypothetical protein EYH15_01700 [Methanothermococcus okinawensis]|uniref:Uncharacterized protein n=1 Tax=Methanothermococcus okinawensis TaxID=155863 RepID=A0A832ZB60_9EURY|nr:hypothetical protein [Methanococcaceae archaeon]HIP84191.1 hypothetical protein [Methanothermococcus okinawensis]HIP91420.1 hypothetical protein [Methanothermococcus okinawensis]
MYRLLLLLEGILFIYIPYKSYILLGILLSFILVYFKKSWGFLIYLITLLWLSNLVLVRSILSLNILYTTVYLLIPAILYLDALLKRDFKLDLKLLGIFSIPLLVYLLLSVLNIDREILTLTYVPLLIYGIYLNFKDNIPRLNTFIKISTGVLIPVLFLYLLYINFPDLLSYPRSQISILLGFTGLYLLLYKIRSINH